jgi:phosphatidate cytidylyltransferase
VTVPVLLGAAWWFGLVTLLSLLCFGEYARALGFFREKLMSLMVVIGILLVSFAILDHWYPLFVALSSLVVSAMAAVAILRDEPKGYIQRVTLAVFGFILFGVCLGHLGYIGNATRYRSAVVVLLFCVQMNDVFAFLCGKAIGGPKLAPRTSPDKTIAGSVGALILTTALFSLLARVAFQGTAVGSIVHGIALGCIVSVTGQFGDLAISSLKRDIGIKDTGSLIPGHGGVLDRANSLLFASPAFFHYIDYFQPDWLDPAIRILSGGN